MAPTYQAGKLDYELVVIGGGSGGIACAREAAGHGVRVAIVDYVKPTPSGRTWGIGGTCINVGCIPKKIMHCAAVIGEWVRDSKYFGWKVPENIEHDWEKLVQAVSDHIKSINFVTKVQLREEKIDYIKGRAQFVDSHNITVHLTNGSERHIVAAKFVIAVGGRPIYPDIPGCYDHAITSDDIFFLEQPPGKTLIIGAGYIGLECAGFLRSFGYDITVMVRSVVLRGFDRQMCDMIISHMENMGVTFVYKPIVLSIEKQSDGRKLVKWESEEDNQEYFDLFNTVLVAVGRHAATRDLGLDAAGVEIVAESGKIRTKCEQTSMCNIYAIGDVVHGKPELTPVAINAGKLLANRLFNKSKLMMDYENVATTIFTPLEYSCVGMSEEKAIEKYGQENIEVFHAFYKPTSFPVAKRSWDSCYIKVIALRDSPEKVIGIHFLGPDAGEVMQGFSTAMKCGLTMDNLQNTVGIHPTCAEEINRIYITKRSGVDPKPAACCY